MRSVQVHSGGNKVGPSLQVNVEIPSLWVDHIYRVVLLRTAILLSDQV